MAAKQAKTKQPDSTGKIAPLGLVDVRANTYLQTLETIVESTSDAVYAKDLNGRYVFFNSEASKITGKTFEQAIGNDDYSLFPPDEAKKIIASDRAVMASGEIKTYEETVTSATGEVKVYLSTKGPLVDARGKMYGLFGIVRDITERKRAEAALRESEERLRSFAETMVQGVIFHDATGKITSLNPAAERILGRTKKELLYDSLSSLDQYTIRENGDPFPGIEHPPMKALRSGQPVESVIMGVFNPKHNGYRWISIGSVPLFKAEETKPYMVYAVFEDITERKLAEDTLRANEEFLGNIIESTPSSIFTLDTKNRYTLINSSTVQFHKLPKEKILGKTVEELFPQQVAQKIIKDDDQIIATGKSISLEESLVTKKDEKPRILLTTKFPIRNSQGQIIGIGGVATDITELRIAKEEALHAKLIAETAKNKAKFLDIAAHELRTPVTSISLLLQLARNQIKKGQPPSPTTLARLQDPVDQLTRLVVDLLDVSRLERGLMELRLVRTNIHMLVSKSLEEFRLHAPGRHFTLSVTGEPVEIDLDPLRIHQVLTNLLDNAIKYTPRDSPIEVRIEPRESAVSISVTDHGEGIPKPIAATLFNPFSRGSSDATLRASGLGLGLSICRGILKLHGGTIQVASEPGRGSTFYFELPKKRLAS